MQENAEKLQKQPPQSALAYLCSMACWSRVVGWLNILGWLSFVIALITFHYARPEPNTILTHFFGIPVRDYWLITLSDLYLIALSFGLCLSCLSLALNIVMYRSSREHYWFNLVILIFMCVAGFVYYLVSI
ncbi:hypothetical protein [Idiomarina xiamenensis]|uniref:Uncharacterized protein n=1 Tax=Idiomarina xiamenensis 10-D-4 TaxID=740709 RepID=K2KG29_9GAMM|nr:hypothetical protein [Idiomarina xiamenensis]EKE86968.1 hypothetical protein A10D4_01962 [Idiomarina xiamenensis 10-D-4]